MRKFCMIVFALSCGSVAFAQKTQKVFTKSYGISTATNTTILGGVLIRYTRPSKPFLDRLASNYYVLEIDNIKSLREKFSPSVNSERVILGKINYLFNFRPQVGKEITVFKKLDSEGIGFNFILAGGPSFGIEKPYYIKYDTGKNSPDRIIYVPFNPAVHLDASRILGKGSLASGLLESKIIPGIHLKTAFNFDISAFKENATGIELGVLTELFSRRPNLMAYSESPSFYVSPFVSLYFGKKKLK